MSNHKCIYFSDLLLEKIKQQADNKHLPFATWVKQACWAYIDQSQTLNQETDIQNVDIINNRDQ